MNFIFPPLPSLTAWVYFRNSRIATNLSPCPNSGTKSLFSHPRPGIHSDLGSPVTTVSTNPRLEGRRCSCEGTEDSLPKCITNRGVWDYSQGLPVQCPEKTTCQDTFTNLEVLLDLTVSPQTHSNPRGGSFMGLLSALNIEMFRPRVIQ